VAAFQYHGAVGVAGVESGQGAAGVPGRHQGRETGGVDEVAAICSLFQVPPSKT
jgi:hypothetical protein